MTNERGTGQGPRKGRRSGASGGGAGAGEPTIPTDPAGPVAVETIDAPWLSRLEHRSPDSRVCPFLRVVDDGGSLRSPLPRPDAFNRCGALREAVPQSLRQQELVCLTLAHVHCPRYLRGALVAVESQPASPRRLRGLRPAGLTPAILAAVLVFVASFAGSIAFVVARGGLALPTAAPEAAVPSPTVLAAVPSPTPQATTPATPTPTAVPTAAQTPAPTPAPTPTPTPTAAPTAAPTPTPTPVVTPPPATPRPTLRPTEPSGDPILARFPELRPCPGSGDCYIYRVRRGNNFVSIVNYYRVSYDRVIAMNPDLGDPSLIRVGDEIRIPTPRRPAP